MKDGKHKKKTEARNNLLTTANIPHSTEDKPEHESLGVIVQQQWQHPERPIGITGGNTSKSRLHVASSPLDPNLRDQSGRASQGMINKTGRAQRCRT